MEGNRRPLAKISPEKVGTPKSSARGKTRVSSKFRQTRVGLSDEPCRDDVDLPIEKNFLERARVMIRVAMCDNHPSDERRSACIAFGIERIGKWRNGTSR